MFRFCYIILEFGTRLDHSSELIRLENNALKLRVEFLLLNIDDLTTQITALDRTTLCLEQRLSYLEGRYFKAEASYSSTIAAIRLRFSSELNLLNEQLSLVSCKLVDLEARLSKVQFVRSRLKSKNLALSQELSALASESQNYLKLKQQLLNPLTVLKFFCVSIKLMVVKCFAKGTLGF